MPSVPRAGLSASAEAPVRAANYHNQTVRRPGGSCGAEGLDQNAGLDQNKNADVLLERV